MAPFVTLQGGENKCRIRLKSDNNLKTNDLKRSDLKRSVPRLSAPKTKKQLALMLKIPTFTKINVGVNEK